MNDLPFELRHDIAKKLTTNCSIYNSKSKDEIIKKLLYTCGKEHHEECISPNVQRISDLCGELIDTDILKFKEELNKFSRNYNMTRRQTFEQLAESWSMSIDQVESLYVSSVSARNMNRRFMNTKTFDQDIVVDIYFKNSLFYLTVIRQPLDEVEEGGDQVEFLLQKHHKNRSRYKEKIIDWSERVKLTNIFKQIFTDQYEIQSGKFGILFNIEYDEPSM